MNETLDYSTLHYTMNFPAYTIFVALINLFQISVDGKTAFTFAHRAHHGLANTLLCDGNLQLNKVQAVNVSIHSVAIGWLKKVRDSKHDALALCLVSRLHVH